MPIYEYECDACGHHMEALQKFSDPPLSECEECHSSKIKKLISQSTFHLKGTGWYVTDYASKRSDSSTPKTEKTEKKEAKKEAKSSSAESKTKESSSKSTPKDSTKD